MLALFAAWCHRKTLPAANTAQHADDFEMTNVGL